jgi:hypothetical protein
VLGLVSSKTPELDSLDQLKRRTEEATRYIDFDRSSDHPAMRLCGDDAQHAGRHKRRSLNEGDLTSGWTNNTIGISAATTGLGYLVIMCASLCLGKADYRDPSLAGVLPPPWRDRPG